MANTHLFYIGTNKLMENVKITGEQEGEIMKKKIFFDVVLSIASTFIPLFGLQFIILPQVSQKIGAESYGQMLAIVALFNLFGSAFGSVLNNSKLIQNNKYKMLNLTGDFNNILLIYVIIDIILITVTSPIYWGSYNLNLPLFFMIIISSVFLILQYYMTSEYRIKLNYKFILSNSIIQLIGYLIGFVAFMITKKWVYIYLISFSFSVVFIIKTTSILKESFYRTAEFNSTFKQTNILLGSGILVSLGGYIDKLIIFPLLGGAALSIYYVSTILGKTISMAIGPITSVLLSYLSQFKKFSHKNFKVMVLVVSSTGVFGYFIILSVSEFILTLLYPQFVNEALKYIPVTTATIVINIIASFINPVIMKFTNAKWQIYIYGVHLVSYVLFSVLMQINYGLYGFCIGLLISQIIKLLIMLFAYQVNRNAINAGAQES